MAMLYVFSMDILCMFLGLVQPEQYHEKFERGKIIHKREGDSQCYTQCFFLYLNVFERCSCTATFKYP